MNKNNESIDQRISAFINRKAKQFPDIDLHKSLNEQPKPKGVVASFFRTIAIGR